MAPTAKPTKKDSKSKQKALVTSKEQDSISKPAKSLKRKETENLDENNDVVALKASRKTKKLKAPTPEPEPSAEEEEQDVAAEDSGENDTHLHGFSTDDDDSSDEEDIAEEEPSTFDVAKLPTIAKDDAIVKRKLEKAKRNPVRRITDIQNVTSHLKSLHADGGSRRSLFGPSASWFLRGTNEGVFLSIRECDATSYLAKQKGALTFLAHPRVFIVTSSCLRRRESRNITVSSNSIPHPSPKSSLTQWITIL
jgi:hypothetical protein